MSTLTFTSAQLLSFSRTAKGGKAVFSSLITQAVIKGMGWAEMPECFTGGTLDGELDATQIDITPADKALAKHAMTLEISRVKKFEVVRMELEEKRGKGHRNELRFVVEFPDLQGCKKLEAYILTAGKSTVKVAYTPQAVQEELPGAKQVTEDDNPDLPEIGE